VAEPLTTIDRGAPTDRAAATDRAALYRQVLDLYARQMQAVDGGDLASYGVTFAPDAVFRSNALPGPVRGRDTICASTRRLAAFRAARGVTRRHLMTNLTVDPRDDGTLATRSYVLLVETSLGEPAELYLSTVCEDELVPDGDGWLVARRHVHRDDLP